MKVSIQHQSSALRFIQRWVCSWQTMMVPRQTTVCPGKCWMAQDSRRPYLPSTFHNVLVSSWCYSFKPFRISTRRSRETKSNLHLTDRSTISTSIFPFSSRTSPMKCPFTSTHWPVELSSNSSALNSLQKLIQIISVVFLIVHQTPDLFIGENVDSFIYLCHLHFKEFLCRSNEKW